MDENKVDVIAEQAKVLVDKAVGGFSNQQKAVIAGCAIVDGVVFIIAWEGCKKAVPAIKKLLKKTFSKKPVEVVTPEVVE